MFFFYRMFQGWTFWSLFPNHISFLLLLNNISVSYQLAIKNLFKNLKNPSVNIYKPYTLQTLSSQLCKQRLISHFTWCHVKVLLYICTGKLYVCIPELWIYHCSDVIRRPHFTGRRGVEHCIGIVGHPTDPVLLRGERQFITRGQVLVRGVVRWGANRPERGCIGYFHHRIYTCIITSYSIIHL